MTKLGFIGTGNMGSAIIRGLSAKNKDISLFAYDKDTEKAKSLIECGVTLCEDEISLVK